MNPPFSRFLDGPKKGQFDRLSWYNREIELLSPFRWSWIESVEGDDISIDWDGKTVAISYGLENIPTEYILFLKDLFPERLFTREFGYPVTLLGKAPVAKYGVQFILNDIYCFRAWRGRAEVERVAGWLKIPPSVDLGQFPIQQAVDAVEDGLHSAYGDFPARGMIGTAPYDLHSRLGERIQVEVKTEDFPG